MPVFVLMMNQYSVTGFIHVMYYSVVLGFISAQIPALIYARRVSVLDAVWAPVYSFYNMLLLWWIPVYAFFTARNSNWLTREIRQSARCEKKTDVICHSEAGME